LPGDNFTGKTGYEKQMGQVGFGMYYLPGLNNRGYIIGTIYLIILNFSL